MWPPKRGVPAKPVIVAAGGRRAFALSRIGASHIKAEKGCQDAFGITEANVGGRAFLLCAVADGHGGERHYLSEWGAVHAVNCCVGALRALCEKYGESTEGLYDAVRAELPALLFGEWAGAVEEDYAQTYLDDDPIEAAVDRQTVPTEDVLRKFGTTAMFCLAFNDGFSDVTIFGKLDGNIVAAKDGVLAEQLPEDDALIGSEAYSLCKKGDALNKWRMGIVYDAPFVMLSTDGLRNSFGETDDDTLFLRCCDEIRDYSDKHGIEGAVSSLPSFLERCSAEGSGDDITLCCILGTVSDAKAPCPLH